jgi:hypothetical protein
MKYQLGDVPSNFKDVTGVTFGFLTVTGRAGSKRNKATWSCRCVCGKDVSVTGDALRQGQFSCGCQRKTVATHGMSRSRTFKIWSGMSSRCNNPKSPAYKNYGERGVKVCERWGDFSAFLSDMGECPKGFSIERVDVNGGYDPTNCKWIPLADQGKNKRNSIRVNGQSIKELSEANKIKEGTARYRIANGIDVGKRVGRDKMITHNGMTMNQKQWAVHIGVSRTTITQRIKSGKSTAEVLRAIH